MSDNDKTIELNRRRVLGGIATIGAASAALGAGTFAYFSDTAQSQNNSITTGNLALGDINEAPMSVDDLAPGETTPELQITSNYTGDVAPTLDWGISVANDDTSGPSGSLAEVLNVSAASLEIDDGTGYTEVDTYDGQTLDSLQGVIPNVANSGTSPSLNDGDTVRLTLQFGLQGGVGNAYQGASLDYGVAFKARQDAGSALQESEITVNP